MFSYVSSVSNQEYENLLPLCWSLAIRWDLIGTVECNTHNFQQIETFFWFLLLGVSQEKEGMKTTSELGDTIKILILCSGYLIL